MVNCGERMKGRIALHYFMLMDWIIFKVDYHNSFSHQKTGASGFIPASPVFHVLNYTVFSELYILTLTLPHQRMSRKHTPTLLGLIILPTLMIPRFNLPQPIG